MNKVRRERIISMWRIGIFLWGYLICLSFHFNLAILICYLQLLPKNFYHDWLIVISTLGTFFVISSLCPLIKALFVKYLLAFVMHSHNRIWGVLLQTDAASIFVLEKRLEIFEGKTNVEL